MRLARLIGPELESLLESDEEVPQDVLDEIHPEDVADIVDRRSDPTATKMLLSLPEEYAAQVFERLDEDRQEALAQTIGVAKTVPIAQEMDADDLADFLSVVPQAMSEQLIDKLEEVDPEVAEDVQELIRWPETSAGGLMTTDYVVVKPGTQMNDAIEDLRKAAKEAEALDVVFVAEGEEDSLLGMLTLRDLLLAGPEERVDDVMHQNVISVPPELDQEAVAAKLAKYDLNTMPVVNEKGELLGVITSDDILDVMTEEQDEDVQKMAAVEPLEEGYFDVSVFDLVRKRVLWLFILFVGGFLTTFALERFDRILASVAQLAFYLPLIISAGGNSGSQSSTLIIRGLATGDVVLGDWIKVFVRELLQGISLGAVLGVLGGAWALANGHGNQLALLITLTILGLVLTGCLIGGLMPLLLHRLGIDPATSSTPFIATLVDVLGILIYLGLAGLLLAEMLAQAPVGP